MLMNVKFSDKEVNELLKEAKKTIDELKRITMKLSAAMELKAETAPESDSDAVCENH